MYVLIKLGYKHFVKIAVNIAAGFSCLIRNQALAAFFNFLASFFSLTDLTGFFLASFFPLSIDLLIVCPPNINFSFSKTSSLD